MQTVTLWSLHFACRLDALRICPPPTLQDWAKGAGLPVGGPAADDFCRWFLGRMREPSNLHLAVVSRMACGASRLLSPSHFG